MEWKFATNETPFVYEAGDWDGTRSDQVVAEDINGHIYIARVYSGTLDGTHFTDWVDSNDDYINSKIKRWFNLPD